MSGMAGYPGLRYLNMANIPISGYLDTPYGVDIPISGYPGPLVGPEEEPYQVPLLSYATL
jgi:hypothetical protein